MKFSKTISTLFCCLAGFICTVTYGKSGQANTPRDHKKDTSTFLKQVAESTKEDDKGNTVLHRVLSGTPIYGWDGKYSHNGLDYALTMSTLQQSDKKMINKKNHNGYTPLWNVLISLNSRQHDQEEALKKLIKKGANVNELSDIGAVPLTHYLRCGNNLEVVKCFIEAEADIHAVDNNGDTPLGMVLNRSRSFRNNNANDTIALHLIKAGADCKEDPEILLKAVQHSSPRVVKAIIEAGADVNGMHPQTGSTPLHEASSVPVAKLLLEKGADTDYKDSSGTALERHKKQAGWATYPTSRAIADLIEKHLSHKKDQNNVSNSTDVDTRFTIEFLARGLTRKSIAQLKSATTDDFLREIAQSVSKNQNRNPVTQQIKF